MVSRPTHTKNLEWYLANMLVGCRDIAIRMYAIFCTVYLGKYNVVYSVHCTACRVIEEKFVVSFVVVVEDY